MVQIPLTSSVVFNALENRVDDLEAAVSGLAAPEPIVWRGEWVTATAYLLGDGVSHSGSSYVCLIPHTSGTFATDLAASKWQILAEKGAPGTGGNYETSSNLVTSAAIATHFATSDLPVFLDTNVTISANPQTFPSNARFVHGGGKFVKSGSGKIAFAGIGLTDPMSQSPLFSGFAVNDITFTGTSYPYRINAGLWDNANWGDRAQAAINAFGTKFVWIDVNEGGSLVNQLVIETKKVVQLGVGTFNNDCAYTPNIRQKDFSVYCGSGRDVTTVYTSTDIGDDPTGVGAFGWYDFAANPANNDTILFNGVTYTFKTTPAGGTDIQIGTGATGSDTNLGITIFNLVTALNASANGSISVATYDGRDVNGSVTTTVKNAVRIHIGFDALGNAGKAYTLGTVHANISRSETTLVGSERPFLYSYYTDGTYIEGIHSHGFTLKGQTTGVTCYSAFSAILYGSGRNCSIHDISFDHTHNFHAYMGVFGNQGVIPESCSIYNLYINGTMTQSVGFLLGRNCTVDNIVWDDVSWHPMSPSGVLVDLEPNVDGLMENCRISNLIADGRSAHQTWALLTAQGVDLANSRSMSFSNLQAIGGELFDYVFTDTNVDLTNNKIYIPGHSLKAGQQVWLTNTGGALPGGLTTGRYYFAVIDTVDPVNYIKLAENYWMALAGNVVDLTSAAGGGHYALTLFGLLFGGISIDGYSGSTFDNILVVRSRAQAVVVKNSSFIRGNNVSALGCGGNGSKAIEITGVSDSEFSRLSAVPLPGAWATTDQQTLAEAETSKTCNTAGTAINVPVGGVRRWWEGKTVTINGTDRVVDQYIDSYHFTVTTSAGTNTGVTLVTKFSNNTYHDITAATVTRSSTGTSKFYYPVEVDSSGNSVFTVDGSLKAGAITMIRNNNSGGWVGVNTADGATGSSSQVRIMGDVFLGNVSTPLLVRSTGQPVLPAKAAPASASATGEAGEIRWDSGFIYICTATNTWKRCAISTW